MKRTALAACLVAVLAVACGGSSATRGRTTKPPSGLDTGDVRATVMFVGDSNISFALTAVGWSLADRDEPYQIVDVARGGTGIRFPDCPGAVPPLGAPRDPAKAAACPTTDFWRVRLSQAFEHVTPDAFIVNLGINDTLTPGTATTQGYESYGTKIDWLMRQLPRSKPVWWTTIPCRIEPKARAVGCDAVNAALTAAPKRWPNLTVLDWADVADPHPNYLLVKLGGDHLSGPGALAWAKLITHALDAHFRP